MHQVPTYVHNINNNNIILYSTGYRVPHHRTLSGPPARSPRRLRRNINFFLKAL